MIPFGVAGALAAGGSLLGGIFGASSATNAAQIQAQAAKAALGFEQNVYNQTSQNLGPYVSAGTNALSALQTGLGSYQGQLDPNAPLLQPGTTAPGGSGPYPSYPSFPSLPQFNPTGFQQSPGYQWQLGQGINAAENLGSRSQGTVSGNTLKALQTYGTGLANQDYYNWLQSVYTPTYNSQLQNTLLPYQANVGQYNAGVNQWLNLLNAYNTAQTNSYNRLSGLTSTGQNSAVNQGNLGQNFAGQASQNITGAGNALGAGVVGASNAIQGGLNSGSTNLLLSQFLNNNSGGGIGNALSQFFGGNQSTVGNSFALNPNVYGANPYAAQAPTNS